MRRAGTLHLFVVACAAALALLAAPARAQTHAWSAPAAVGHLEVQGEDAWSGPEVGLRAAAGARGDLAVAWSSIGADEHRLYVARAARGGAFGPPELLVAQPAPSASPAAGVRLLDLVVDGTGRVAVLFGRLDEGSSTFELSTGAAGGPFTSPAVLGAAPGDAEGPQDAAIAPDPDGGVLAATLAQGTVTVERWTGAATGEPVASAPASATGRRVSLGASGTVVVVATASDTASEDPEATQVVRVDRTTGAIVGEQTVDGISGRLRQGSGGHLALQARAFQRAVTSSAGPGAAFTPAQGLSEHALSFEQPVDVAPDGTVAVGWGGMDWVDSYERVLVALGAAGAPLRRVASPPVDHGMHWGRVPLAFDGASRLVAMGSAVRRDGTHPSADGRVVVAMRAGADWCTPEVVTEDAMDRPLGALAFDGLGGGVAAWRDLATGAVRVARYTARDTCPPAPPPPDPQPMPQSVLDVMRPPPDLSPTPTAPVAPAPAPRAALVVPAAATVRRSGAVSLPVRCTLATTCRGRFELRAARRLWAARGIAVRAGRRQRVTLRLTPAARRRVARRRRARVTAVTRLAGRPVVRRPITLRRAR